MSKRTNTSTMMKAPMRPDMFAPIMSRTRALDIDRLVIDVDQFVTPSGIQAGQTNRVVRQVIRGS